MKLKQEMNYYMLNTWKDYGILIILTTWLVMFQLGGILNTVPNTEYGMYPDLRPCCMKQIDGNVLKNIPIESLQVGDLVEVNFQIVTYNGLRKNEAWEMEPVKISKLIFTESIVDSGMFESLFLIGSSPSFYLAAILRYIRY